MKSDRDLSDTNTKLKRIAWLSAQQPERQFDQLIHFFNEESLTTCFHELCAKKAVGIDGIDKSSYGENLNNNLKELLARMKNMAYRPEPMRQVMIPKDGKPSTFRPLAISNFEDKIVQKMMQKILNSIYEPLFLDCSFGFRPGKSCHDARGSLHKYLHNNEVQTVLDVDLANFFGTIGKAILLDLLKNKINDQKLLRYLMRMLKAGVLADGDLMLSEEGVPQGSVCSPILANIFAHYAIDVWFNTVVKAHCAGQVEMFRYCDDLVVCCQYERDAIRIRKALKSRLAKFNLQLNEEKTKLVHFSKCANQPKSNPNTFNFLGFTFYWGHSRKGSIIPKVKTEGRRLRNKLKNVNLWVQKVRNKYRLADIWKTFCSKLEGHIRYYSVSTNFEAVRRFRHGAEKILFKHLNRRSQRRTFNWDQFKKYEKLYPLPRVRVCYRLY